MVLAVGFRIGVGIKLEVLADTAVDDELMRRVLTRPEAGAVSAAPDRRAEFFKLWSRKQALARALGRDPADEPKTLSVLGLPPVAWDEVEVIDVNLGDRVAAAVAVPRGCSIELTALVDVEERSTGRVPVVV